MPNKRDIWIEKRKMEHYRHNLEVQRLFHLYFVTWKSDQWSAPYLDSKIKALRAMRDLEDQVYFMRLAHIDRFLERFVD